MYLALAIVSSLLYNGSIVLQARDAAAAPADVQMQAGMFLYLVRRWLWVVGTLCLISAAVLQTIALVSITVDVMQSLTAAGILLLPLWARWLLRERFRAPELAVLAVLVGAVTVATLSIDQQHEHSHLGALTLSIGAAVISLVALGLARASRNGTVLAFAAGVGFSGTTIMQKQLAVAHHPAQLIPALVGVAVCAIAGFVCEMWALGSVSALRVAPTLLAVSTAVPVLLAPALFGEHWSHPVVLVISLVVIVAASALVARSGHAAARSLTVRSHPST